MLHGNGFENFYKKTVIYNCNVKVYKNDDTPTLLLDSANISRFNIRRFNNGVLDEVLGDDATIEVVRWNALSSSIKSYFVEKAVVKITFIVEDVETSDAIVLIVDNVDEDLYDPTKATIKLVSPIAKMTTSDDARGYLLQPHSANPTYTAPFKMTNAVEIQQLSVNYARGRTIRPVSKTAIVTNWDRVAMASNFELDNTPYLALYDKKNVGDKFGRYKDKNDRSQINVYGLNSEADWVIAKDEIESSSPIFNIFLDQQYAEIGVELYYKDSGGTWHYEENPAVYQFTNMVEVQSTMYGAYGYKVTIHGRKVEETAPNDDSVFISSKFWHDTQTDRLNKMRDVFRDYYSNNTYYEFDCRIDPRIEPQDNVYINGIGTLRIEEVEINFDGGFTGHIKGRKVFDYPLIPKPTVSFTSQDPYSYSFILQNISEFDCDITIDYSGALTYVFHVNAGQSIIINRDNAPALYDSFYAKAQGLLSDDVYCYSVSNVGASKNRIILEADR